MKAIAIVPGTAGARIVDRPEPSVSTTDGVKIRMIRVGIAAPTVKSCPEGVLRPRRDGRSS